MTDLSQNRWTATEDDFAVKIELSDVPGYFSKSLKIDLGMKALFLENGVSVGEVPPGDYTLQSVVDKLKFWTRKSTTVVLTRAEEVSIDLAFPELLTSELLEVQVDVRLTVQIKEVALFLKNMLGSRQSLSKQQLRDTLFPFVKQALWEAIGRLSVKDLTGGKARGDLEICISQALYLGLERQGLKFGHVVTLSVAHPQYDAQRRRIGQLWLQRAELEHEDAEAKLAADRLFAETQRQEHLDELNILAAHVDADRREGNLAVKMRRIGIRKQWRDAIQSEEFARITTEEEMRRFLQERDKAREIDAAEYDSLLTTLRDKTADEAAKRKFLLQKLAIEQACELGELKADLDHAQKLKTLKYETELTLLVESESSRKWEQELRKEAISAEARREAESKEFEHARARARTLSTDLRGEALEDVLSTQRIKRVEGEIKLSEVENGRRIAIIEIDVERMRKDQTFEDERRFGLLEIELGLGKLDVTAKESDLQIDRWERLQAIKIARRKAEVEMELQRDQSRRDFKLKREQNARQAALEILRVKEQIQAQAKSEEDRRRREEKAEEEKRQREKEEKEEKRRQEDRADLLQRQLAEKADKDKASQSNRDEAASLTQAFHTMFAQHGEIMNNVTRNMATQPQAPTIVAVPGSVAPPTTGGAVADVANRVVLCSGCRAENPSHNRFCTQCGKGL